MRFLPLMLLCGCASPEMMMLARPEDSYSPYIEFCGAPQFLYFAEVSYFDSPDMWSMINPSIIPSQEGIAFFDTVCPASYRAGVWY